LSFWCARLWADLDRDRRVGGPRPNQNYYVLCNTCNAPKSYIETTDRRNFGDKPSKRTSWKIPEFRSVFGARSKTAFFSRFNGTLRLSCTQPRGNSFTPNQSHPWKAETLKVCLSLVWTDCDQAFGRYKPLNVAEKWTRDDHESWKFAYRTRRKIHWFQKCYFFDLRRKITKLSQKRKTPFRTVASPGACGIFSTRQF